MIKVNKKDYISASQINSFIERRDQFIRNYVFGAPWKGSSYFSRGNAVEWGLDRIIDGLAVEDAAEKAWQFYQRDCIENDLSDSEAAKISKDDVVNSVLAVGNFYVGDLDCRNKKVSKQHKISLKHPSISKPILGFCDYVFEASGPFDKGCVRDLKTAAKTPSKLSPGYKLQGTLYHLATGLPVVFDTVTNLKKCASVKSINLTDDDIAEYKPIIIAAAKAMEDFWTIVPDEIDNDYIDAFNSLAFPNIHGMWNEEERQEAIKEWCHDIQV